MGRFARLRPVQRWAQPRWTPAAATGLARATRSGDQSSFFGDYTLSEHDPFPAAATVPRQSGDGAAHQEPGALECASDGGAGEQETRRYRRTHFDLCFGGDAV